VPCGIRFASNKSCLCSTFHEIAAFRCGIPAGNTICLSALFPVGRSKLRMPILSYFLVVGGALVGLLLLFGNGNGTEPIGAPLTSAQTVGLPSFKPEPETEHARVTAVNFAAAYKHSEGKSAKTAETRPRPKAIANYSKPESLSRFAEFPHTNLNIH
jgi:hypothetical protein